ncbi:MAG: NADH-quinone oxidoreductase subunit M [Phycisphaerae bacterium]|nr:NADH-quinone oxidoreductase subunit M [Phycisphaerae bacterium]
MALLALILVPLLFAGYVALRPEREAKSIALWGTLGALGISAWTLFDFDWGQSGVFQYAESFSWVDAIGLRLSVGADSVSLMLIALTAFLGPVCVLCSRTAITHRQRTFYAWLLVLQAAMTGVFAARDLVLFYVCFEFTLIPMWVLINLYGSTNRKKAATKFFLYTFTGSLIALAGLVYVVWFKWSVSQQWTFDLYELQRTAARMSSAEQAWVLLALLAGFAVKVPLFPVHTWLPLAHTEAPTAGSVILAGVLLKLGTYGIFRFALPFCPLAIGEYAPLIAGLSIVGIVYAGLVCWVQTDVKKLVAYSSVAHLGFCVLGMVALNDTGITGSILYMINHGLSTGALFVLIGMIYERYHTRSMDELGGLAARMPVWSSFMVFFTMASVGLPGLNGFVSEFLCLLGAFQASHEWAGTPGGTPGRLGFVYAAVAGTGMIVAAIYLLYMVGRVVFGPLVEPHGHGNGSGHGHGNGAAHGNGDAAALPRDLNWREIGTLLPLAIACVGLGVYPSPVIQGLRGPVATTVAVTKEGAAYKPPARADAKPPEVSR